MLRMRPGRSSTGCTEAGDNDVDDVGGCDNDDDDDADDDDDDDGCKYDDDDDDWLRDQARVARAIKHGLH